MTDFKKYKKYLKIEEENKELKALLKEIYEVCTLTKNQTEYSVLNGIVQKVTEMTRKYKK